MCGNYRKLKRKVMFLKETVSSAIWKTILDYRVRTLAVLSTYLYALVYKIRKCWILRFRYCSGYLGL